MYDDSMYFGAIYTGVPHNNPTCREVMKKQRLEKPKIGEWIENHFRLHRRHLGPDSRAGPIFVVSEVAQFSLGLRSPWASILAVGRIWSG